MAMNPEIKAKWVAALRSGEYTQGLARLQRRKGEFCCLGVLCDLHAKEHSKSWTQSAAGQLYMEHATVLPTSVREWAGLEVSTGGAVVIDKTRDSLTTHNDKGATFAEIADAIEGQL